MRFLTANQIVRCKYVTVRAVSQNTYIKMDREERANQPTFDSNLNRMNHMLRNIELSVRNRTLQTVEAANEVGSMLVRNLERLRASVENRDEFLVHIDATLESLKSFKAALESSSEQPGDDKSERFGKYIFLS